MKYTKILSLFFLLTSAQMHGSSAQNPELSFVFAFQYVNNLSEAISSDNDDIAAIKLLQAMNDYIAFDASQKKALAASQNSFLYKGVPLDAAKIAAQDKALQDKINTYNKDIKALQGSNKTLALAHKKKIEDRRHSRNEQQKQLDENLAAIKENASAANVSQANAAAVNALISKNALAFEQALESYIASFGQCYIKQAFMSAAHIESGSPIFGLSTIISSKYRPDMPITPKEFALLITTLNNAYSQFGSTITITLALTNNTSYDNLKDNSESASIKDVASYMNNMAPQSSSYATYAAYGLAAAAATTAAIAGGAIAYNMYQGQDLSTATNNMMSDAGNLYNKGAATANDWYTAAVNALGYQTTSQHQAAQQKDLMLQAAEQAKQDAANQDAKSQQYYDNLFDEIDATMNQSGGMNLTPDEIHALAPYAAGVLGSAALGAAATVGGGAAAGMYTNYRVAQGINALGNPYITATPKLLAGAQAGAAYAATHGAGIGAAVGLGAGAMTAGLNSDHTQDTMNAADYDNLFNEIDATMNQSGGMKLTADEIHTLAPYAAGALGVATLGGAGMLGKAALAGAATSTRVAGATLADVGAATTGTNLGTGVLANSPTAGGYGATIAGTSRVVSRGRPVVVGNQPGATFAGTGATTTQTAAPITPYSYLN